MITAGKFALHFKTERRRRRAWTLAGLRVVKVEQVWTGPLGTFAEIDPAALNKYGHRASEIIDARELLDLGALENLSPAAGQMTALQTKAGPAAV